MRHLFDRGMSPQEPYGPASKGDASLAPYAVKDAVGYGRVHPETRKDGDDRTRFFIDVGRAVHSDQMRVLFGKAQVYPSTVLEHVSNRGTHSHEVGYLSESFARTMGLNADLSRVGGIFHDVGHPPFGHEGETALDHWAAMHGQRFEHNDQLLRIVTKLARRGDRRGMNFNIETLRVLDKHGTWFGWPAAPGPHPYSFLEAQAVNTIDAIDYFSCDAQDALACGTLDRDALATSPLFAKALAISDESGREVRSELINLLKTDLVSETWRQIERLRIDSLEAVVAATEPIVRFSPGIHEHMKAMKTFMYAKMYRTRAKIAYRAAVNTLINVLCCWFHSNPNDAILELETLSDHTEEHPVRVQAVLDYVSSLRDRDALEFGETLGLDDEQLRLLRDIFGRGTEEQSEQ